MKAAQANGLPDGSILGSAPAKVVTSNSDMVGRMLPLRAGGWNELYLAKPAGGVNAEGVNSSAQVFFCQVKDQIKAARS
jgi:hypothetical protein